VETIPSGVWVVPGPATLSEEPPQRDKCDDSVRRQWLANHNSVIAGVSTVLVTLTSTRASTVVVNAPTLQTMVREPRTPGAALVLCPGEGGNLTVDAFGVNLDGEHPQMTYSNLPGSTGKALPQEAAKFTLAANDPLVFEIDASAKEHSYRWSGELTIISDGTRHTYPIDDGGKPFLVTGISEAQATAAGLRPSWPLE
jgi:hypothetical protein